MLLDIKGLKTYYYEDGRAVKAVDDVCLSIEEGEVFALVGESACGKTTLALSIARLISPYDGRIVEGIINFNGKNILKLNEDELRQVRGKEISYIFQEPAASLNPVFTIGEQITEVLNAHGNFSKREARKRTIESLGLAQLPDAERVYASYPHQLSGGMKQRAMIAAAIILRPKLLIADEPTTALDVTVQERIIKLLLQLKNDIGLSILFITHDLNVVSAIADRIGIMYAGRILEQCSKDEFYSSPRHPYTKALLKALPDIENVKRGFYSIPGEVPKLWDLPEGCKFYPRCEIADEQCRIEEPKLKKRAKGHMVRFLKK